MLRLDTCYVWKQALQDMLDPDERNRLLKETIPSHECLSWDSTLDVKPHGTLLGTCSPEAEGHYQSFSFPRLKETTRTVEISLVRNV